jgi:hypothetical protein
MTLLILLSCGPKKLPEVEAGPTSGWHIEQGWSGSCFLPPDFAAIEDAELRDKMRADTVRAMVLQWEGSRRDGVNFDADMSDRVGVLLEAVPERVSPVAAENYELCVEVMRDDTTTSRWGRWVQDLHQDLEDAACPNPLEDTFHTLEVNRGWQLNVELCAGEAYRIKATTTELFQLRPDGDWIGVEGEPELLPPEGAYCREVAGCAWGQLVVRFEGDDGSVQLIPVGGDYEGVAPRAGTLSLAINDDDHSDNRWRVVDGVQDGVTLEVRPR